MRHLRGLVSIEVSLLPRGMMGAPGLGLLVSAGCRQERCATSRLAAGRRAISVTTVAPAT
jgi:hypothetical protein